MGTKVAAWPHIAIERSNPDFSSLYHQHVVTVRRFLSRMVAANDVDDLVQEVFLRIYRFQEGFREEADLKTWIHRICMNAVQDHHRKKRWSGLLSFGSGSDSDRDSGREAVAKGNLAEDIANQNLVARALNRLSVKERAVVVLFYLEERSLEDIGDLLELPLGTIKSRLHSARNKLQSFMVKEGIDL